MSDVETWLDGTTLVVRIPMRFQRRGGRKRIVAPDFSRKSPATPLRQEPLLPAPHRRLRNPGKPGELHRADALAAQ